MTKKVLLSLTGPSGSGKTELLNKLCENEKFKRLISTTTRPMRASEKDGFDYNFTSEAIFNMLLDQSQFVQHIRFQGNYYGTLKADATDILNANVIPVVIVEPSGVEQFRKFCRENDFQLVSVFVTAESLVLIERYLSRMAAMDLMDPQKRKYHAKRIEAVHHEWSTWGSVEDYDLVLTNSENDISKIDDLANHLINKLTND
ncbi:Guanylate kinase [compost metagenome]